MTDAEQPDKDEDDCEQESTVYERYEWDCPACDEVNDEGDIDPAGEVRECPACGAKVRLRR